MPHVINAVKEYATLQEICDVCGMFLAGIQIRDTFRLRHVECGIGFESNINSFMESHFFVPCSGNPKSA